MFIGLAGLAINLTMKKQKWSLQIGGRELSVETNFLAGQANSAAVVKYGDTVVLATAVMSSKAASVKGYFPLMVDFEERYYAAGKIKGSRFIKREGRPSDEAILSGRAVDRSIRPLFNHRMRNEVQVIITVLSIDQENDPDFISIIAASVALAISDIPWNGPIGAVRVGKVNGDWILNPVKEDIKAENFDLVVAGTKDKINMIEAGMVEIPEEQVIQALSFAQEAIGKIVDFIENIRQEIGQEKAKPILMEGTPEFEKEIREFFLNNGLVDILYLGKKKEVYEKIDELKNKVNDLISEKYSAEAEKMREVSEIIFDEISDETIHRNILEKQARPDGRKLDEVRNIDCQVGIIPRTHGTGLFTRGETQALTITTLGAPGAEQIIDTMETDTKKRYIHHYNFPPFSVGETRPMRGPGRREIGHGALAEKALIPVIPSKEEFPYTILLVSEILSSNGSSSMASVCGSTLSLMDAGVPIKEPVSGIAMGVIIDQDKAKKGDFSHYKILSDIQGMEDHYGDMDFKVAGTKNGITALQMDVKVEGIPLEILEKTLLQARRNRLEIMEKMLAVIAVPRENLSQYAPRVITMRINPDKIRDVIGPGGKVINEIIDETGVSIDIEDDGIVFITSSDEISAQKAQKWIENLTHEIKTGEFFNARVTRIMDFGAFAEVLPGQEGLIHISELADHRVAKVDEVVKVGDVVLVKVKNIDNLGRINLSMKEALKEQK